MSISLAMKNGDSLISKSANVLFIPVAILLACISADALPVSNDSDKLSLGEHDAPIRDFQLHYTIAGKGPLVFVSSPGWGAGSLYLQRGLEPLEDRFTLLFIDTRGSGKSSRPADTKVMSSSDMADDIEALRGYLGLNQINLIGHSDSGAIGIYYAERYPTRVAKLVIIDGEAYGDGTNDKPENDNVNQIRVRLANDPRYKASLQPFKMQEGDAGMLQYMKHSLPLYFADPEKNLPLFERTMEGMTPSVFAARANMAANHSQRKDSIARLGDIKAATLIVVGKQDWICPVMNAEDIHRGIAGSELVEIEGSGHFPWIEQPAIFFRSVAAFLKG